MSDASTQDPSLIALDWGTSSLRAYLLDAAGTVLEHRAEPWGIMQIPPASFAERLAAITSEWRARWPGLPALAAGMIGSAQGWIEVPYRPLPAGPAELASGLANVPGSGLAIVPGLVQGGLGADTLSPDVMRGEETQIAGALALRPGLRSRSRLVMPGTHCKWADVTDGRVVRFTTYMTGELFAVLRQHSILGRLAPEGAALDDAAAFRRGVDAARDTAAGVTGLLFSARSLVLTGHMRPGESLDYLSGLLIGEEIKTALRAPDADAPLTLIGEPFLCGRYRHALLRFGVRDPDILENTAPAGLWRIAVAAGKLAAATS